MRMPSEEGEKGSQLVKACVELCIRVAKEATHIRTCIQAAAIEWVAFRWDSLSSGTILISTKYGLAIW